MTIRNQTMIATTLALAGLISACATTAPAQLVDARAAYTTSSNGLVANLSPTELYDAKKVLDKANLEFDQHGDTEECRDLAYIAYRKLGLAEVKARTELDRHQIAEAVKASIIERDSQVKDTQVALASTREQLKQERQDNNAATSELRAANKAQGTGAGQDGRPAGHREAGAAVCGRQAGRRHEGSRGHRRRERRAAGMVITLSGSVLFASGKSELLNGAKTSWIRSPSAQGAGATKASWSKATRTGGAPKGRSAAFAAARRCCRDYLVARGVPARERRRWAWARAGRSPTTVGGEPRQQSARRDRHQHGPDQRSLMHGRRVSQDAATNTARLRAVLAVGRVRDDEHASQRKNGELVRGNPGGRRRRQRSQRRRRSVSAPRQRGSTRTRKGCRTRTTRIASIVCSDARRSTPSCRWRWLRAKTRRPPPRRRSTR